VLAPAVAAVDIAFGTAEILVSAVAAMPVAAVLMAVGSMAVAALPQAEVPTNPQLRAKGLGAAADTLPETAMPIPVNIRVGSLPLVAVMRYPG